MKCPSKTMSAFLYKILLCSVPFFVSQSICFAGWQVAKPDAAIPNDAFFQAGLQQKTIFAPATPLQKFASLGTPAANYAISISGSLKENLERIMCRYQWKIVWRAPYDYNFDGRVTGSSLPNVVERLLSPFPLQAVMYMSNRTMVVTPRQAV